MDSDTLHDYLKSLKHTQSTIKSYLFIISRYLKEHPQANRYDYKDIMDYFKSFLLNMDERPGMALLQSGIKKYYDYLIHIGQINKHPCRSICIKQRRKNVIHVDLFSQFELERLLRRHERYAVLKHRNRLLISLLIYQGLTSSEIAKLKVKDINVDRSLVKIVASATNSGRKLELKPIQLDLLDKYLNKSRKYLQRQNQEALLLNKLGNPMTVDDIHYLIETYKYLYPDRKLTPQTIRQSVIANWLNKYHIPLEDAQLLAGHKRPSATLKYKQANMQQAVETLNRFHPL
jgi:site-specific recombinase XerD